MKRHSRLLVVLAVLLVTANVLHPAVHWRLIGWARGEAFYQGRPTSYWADKIEATYQPVWGTGSVIGNGGTIWYVETQLSRLDQFLQQWLPGTTPVSVPPALTNGPLLDGDFDALPVLLALLRNESAKLRQVAVSGLVAQGRDKPEVIKALHEAAKDPDDLVRQDAEVGLQHLAR
ncbi:hypothetical protein AYO44_06695 [Planctomycetaceae bacterium SCGC AG-212-F19]|nr:hypothetical protein AYO44_06695 [Planctomycetaceae bacterium SCGC AG-212-F19]